MKYTQSHINQLKKSGKIRGFKDARKPKASKPAKKLYKSKALTWIESVLVSFCDLHSYELRKEYQFHPVRKFRFDFAIVNMKIAIEYEGGIFLKKSGHNTAIHYTKDANKYNLSTIEGWKVLRFTALNYKTIGETLDKLVKNDLG